MIFLYYASLTVLSIKQSPQHREVIDPLSDMKFDVVYIEDNSVVVSILGEKKKAIERINVAKEEFQPTDIAIEPAHFTQPNRYGAIVMRPQWQKGAIVDHEVVVYDTRQGKHRLKKAIYCEANNAKGLRCSNKTRNPSGKCWRHDKT